MTIVKAKLLKNPKNFRKILVKIKIEKKKQYQNVPSKVIHSRLNKVERI